MTPSPWTRTADCPLDCPECAAEGIDRPDLMDELVRISQSPDGDT